jgi:hypothetical protein
MMMGVDRSVIGGLYGPRASAPRSEMVGSSESNVLFSEMGRAQFPVAQSPQKTLVGLVFALAVAGVAPD